MLDHINFFLHVLTVHNSPSYISSVFLTILDGCSFKSFYSRGIIYYSSYRAKDFYLLLPTKLFYFRLKINDFIDAIKS